MSASLIPIEFGVFLPSQSYQLLDAIGPVEYINSNTRDYLSGLIPQAYVDKAPVINWHWISSAGDFTPIQATTGPPLPPTANFTSALQLDFLLVPGTGPDIEISAEATEWLKTQYAGLKGLLTVCTGALYLTKTGLLNGVQAATNKAVLKILAEGPNYERFSKVNWVPDARFVVDGKIWTAAGVTSGLDLAAEFVRVYVDEDVARSARELLEYVPNPARPDPFAYLLDGVEV